MAAGASTDDRSGGAPAGGAATTGGGGSVAGAELESRILAACSNWHANGLLRGCTAVFADGYVATCEAELRSAAGGCPNEVSALLDCGTTLSVTEYACDENDDIAFAGRDPARRSPRRSRVAIASAPPAARGLTGLPGERRPEHVFAVVSGEHSCSGARSDERDGPRRSRSTAGAASHRDPRGRDRP
jgi:hypothetical protein